MFDLLLEIGKIDCMATRVPIEKNCGIESDEGSSRVKKGSISEDCGEAQLLSPHYS